MYFSLFVLTHRHILFINEIKINDRLFTSSISHTEVWKPPQIPQAHRKSYAWQQEVDLLPPCSSFSFSHCLLLGLKEMRPFCLFIIFQNFPPRTNLNWNTNCFCNFFSSQIGIFALKIKKKNVFFFDDDLFRASYGKNGTVLQIVGTLSRTFSGPLETIMKATHSSNCQFPDNENIKLVKLLYQPSNFHSSSFDLSLQGILF